jgi:hypothetical protein
MQNNDYLFESELILINPLGPIKLTKLIFQVSPINIPEVLETG